MHDRVFKSYKEYVDAYFSGEVAEPFGYVRGLAASQLAARAIEKNADKLKGIKCIEQLHTHGR